MGLNNYAGSKLKLTWKEENAWFWPGREDWK